MTGSGKDKNIFYIVLGIIGIIAAVIFIWDMRRPAGPAGNAGVPLGELASQPSLYANPDFKVEFRYPRAWKPDAVKGGFHGTYLAFRGEDGHFGIDAVGAAADIPIDQAVRDTVNASGHPYGSKPTMTQATLGGMDARLILPSADQPPERAGEVAFIVRYPKPFMIASSTYFYFVLYVDKDHFQSIGNTFTFISD